MRDVNHSEEVEEAGCASFEATLGLLDGVLVGAEALAAKAHAEGCALCGPMLAEWGGVHTSLLRTFEDAAELAKPDLAGLSERVLAQVARPKVAERPSFFQRLVAALRALQAPVALAAAAAAIAFVVLPMVKDPVANTDEQDDAPETAEVVTPPAGPNDMHVHKLAFDDADGTVMTAGDNMTVIWINEHEGV